jgi:stage II sporulation protein D
LAAWGKAQQRPIATINAISEISVAKRNTYGRPTGFTIADTAGQRYAFSPELFRIACNYSSPELPPLPKGSTLKSSHVSIQIKNEDIFIRGQGHGHGVGMCQWGAQAMARKGYDHEKILAFYYPGANLERAY